MSKDLSPGIFDNLLPESESILDEPALLELFAKRVEEMLKGDIDLLLSSLYRLDVEEYKIQRALRSTDVPAARGIAQLIIDRQKEKIITRKKYASEKKKKDDWEGL
jgi:hypothetical protein